jgi:N-acyl-D-amino-acid deacylase
LTTLLLLLPLVGPAEADPPKEKAIPATGPTDRRLVSFDRIMLDFLKKHPRVPGAALAVARDGKLVYSRGFGYADLQRTQPVQPDSLFRIASVSKPLTAVAVLQLVERGKLKLSDKVFDVLELKEPKGKAAKFDPRWHKVTIQHLLHHTGGWDRDKSFDPMFENDQICKQLKVQSPARQADIIRFMLRQPLDFEPGARDAYSNFGYCLLGRVIEKASGRKYEDQVRQEVLQPVGARQSRLGRTLLEDRFPTEVWYDSGNKKEPAILGPNLGKPVPLAYGAWCLEALDSHGGWIASAADLVRFASAFDHPDRCPLLKAKSIEIMFAPPPGAAGHKRNGMVKAAYYACGWEVRPYGKDVRNTWHSGLLDGTSTILVRRGGDHLSWAVLFNASKIGKDDEPADLIDPLVHEAADAVKQWP